MKEALAWSEHRKSLATAVVECCLKLPVSNGPGTHGRPLNEELAHFDHEAGYPMAWYFLMLAGKDVPHWFAEAVIEDSRAGFA